DVLTHLEGENYFGSTTISATDLGNASFSVSIAKPTSSEFSTNFITATASRLDGSGIAIETSEFSLPQYPIIYFNTLATFVNVPSSSTTVSISVILSQAIGTAITIPYYTVNGTALAGSYYTA